MAKTSKPETPRHPDVSAKTARILREAVESLALHENKFDMSLWIAFGRKRLKPDAANFCGTACCLGGQIVLNAGAKTPVLFKAFTKERATDIANGNEPDVSLQEIPDGALPKFEGMDFEDAAAKIANLTRESSDLLFHVPSWPAIFNRQYYAATSGKQRVNALRLRVEYFIATNE